MSIGGVWWIWESTASTWRLASLRSPISSHYKLLSNYHLVDLYGQGVLIYPDFQVAIQAGKNITSHLPAEIYTKTGTLTLNAVAAINQARFCQPFWGSYRPSGSSPAHTKCKRSLALLSLIKAGCSSRTVTNATQGPRNPPDASKRWNTTAMKEWKNNFHKVEATS